MPSILKSRRIISFQTISITPVKSNNRNALMESRRFESAIKELPRQLLIMTCPRLSRWSHRAACFQICKSESILAQEYQVSKQFPSSFKWWKLMKHRKRPDSKSNKCPYLAVKKTIASWEWNNQNHWKQVDNLQSQKRRGIPISYKKIKSKWRKTSPTVQNSIPAASLTADQAKTVFWNWLSQAMQIQTISRCSLRTKKLQKWWLKNCRQNN